GAWLALPGKIPPEVLQFLATMGILLVLGVAGLLLIPGAETWLRNFGPLKKLLPPKLWAIYQKILDFGFSLIEGVRVLAKNPLTLAVIMAQSFFVWIWDALMVYFILLSLGILEPFSVSLFGSMVGALATAVPLTPGALGQFDAVLIGLLALFGISTADAGLTVLLLRLVQLWTFIPVAGLVTYLFGFSRALNLGHIDTAARQPEPALQPGE
ncbi:MAG: TIGR00374 family protein, partial [Chloroflexi bacterium]